MHAAKTPPQYSGSCMQIDSELGPNFIFKAIYIGCAQAKNCSTVYPVKGALKSISTIHKCYGKWSLLKSWRLAQLSNDSNIFLWQTDASLYDLWFYPTSSNSCSGVNVWKCQTHVSTENFEL